MLPTQNEVLSHVAQLIKQLKEYSIDAFSLPLNDLKPIIGFRDCKTYGTAGSEGLKPFMKLNLGVIVKYPVRAYTEYKSLNRIKGINGFETTDWRLWVDALVIHEFAHVVQDMLMKRPNRLATDCYGTFERFGEWEGGHGNFFIRVYMDLRIKFLNDRIGKFAPAGANFDKPLDAKVNNLVLSLYNGSQVKFKGKIYTVAGTDPKKRKYAIAAFAACGARLNMDRDYVRDNRIN